MANEREDYTGRMGDLFTSQEREWPMYSYSRPASIFWNAVANAMRDAGKSDKQIQEFLQSRDPRYLLDGSWGEGLEKMGYMLGLTICGGPQ